MSDRPYKTILVDQDGVLCAFATYNRMVNNKYMQLRKDLYPDFKPVTQSQMIEDGGYELCDLWGITRDEWWDIIRQNKDFWLSIPMFHWAPVLVAKLREQCDRLVVATKPGCFEDPQSAGQKTEWFKRRQPSLGFGGHDIMIGARKELMAKEGVLLIDDVKANADRFIAEGGDAVVVPSDWNCKLHGLDIVWKTIENYINERRR